jgi:hypothetical protein
MSIASLNSAKYYWPDENSFADFPKIKDKIEAIRNLISQVQLLLFQPPYRRPVNQLQQPLLVAESEKKPFYVAELLTVFEGYRGTSANTSELLKKDKDASIIDIVENGYQILENAKNLLIHLIGINNNSPQTLEIASLFYFYSPEGRYVRNLLYGFVYWMLNGTEEEIFKRKIIFSAYRGIFEHILVKDKSQIVSQLGRRIGSGAEVTHQTARYFQQLFELLVNYQGDIENDEFLSEYATLLDRITDRDAKPVKLAEIKNRIFSEKQKSAAIIEAWYKSIIRCEICNGILNPSGNLQHDHITLWSEGGITTPENQRLTHPFCNNQRKAIADYKNRNIIFDLPVILTIEGTTKPKQLSFINDLSFDT